MALPGIQIAAASDGDVVLVCGSSDDISNASDEHFDETPDAKISFVVSSNVLCLASNVLRTMLLSSMKEGATLARNGTVTVPLPEDNAAAMLVILRILHHQTDLVPESVNLGVLSAVAVLSDKYNFNAPLRPTITTWIRDFVSDSGDEATRESRVRVWVELITAARLLKHHKLAQRAMQGLILHATFPVSGLET